MAGWRRLSSLARNCIVAVILTVAVGAAPPLLAQQSGSSKAGAQGKSEETALGKRMTQLEEQIVDLQVVIGTLQSLVRQQNAGGDYQTPAESQPAPGYDEPAAAGGGAPADLDTRLSVIETQIQALTGQVERLSQQLQQLQAGAGAGGLGMGSGTPAPAEDSPEGQFGENSRPRLR